MSLSTPRVHRKDAVGRSRTGQERYTGTVRSSSSPIPRSRIARRPDELASAAAPRYVYRLSRAAVVLALPAVALNRSAELM